MLHSLNLIFSLGGGLDSNGGRRSIQSQKRVRRYISSLNLVRGLDSKEGGGLNPVSEEGQMKVPSLNLVGIQTGGGEVESSLREGAQFESSLRRTCPLFQHAFKTLVSCYPRCWFIRPPNGDPLPQLRDCFGCFVPLWRRRKFVWLLWEGNLSFSLVLQQIAQRPGFSMGHLQAAGFIGLRNASRRPKFQVPFTIV